MTAIDATLARLTALHPKLIDLSLDRMWRILARLDHPERKLPPVIHVAGTNGKGSTIAFMRAMLEAAGKSVHVYTSPHLVALQRALSSRCTRRRAPGLRRRSRRGADRMRAEKCRRADHGVRDHDRRGACCCFRAIRPMSCCWKSASAAGSMRPMSIERPLASVITPVSLDHAEYLGDTLAGRRGGEGRHHQARRSGHCRAAADEALSGDRAGGDARCARR